MNNLYWPVYKNLEKELSDLSNLIHFDDEQLGVYSIKISELLLRTVVEVESIAKELYFANGGLKPDDNKLYFDTDCIQLLEDKWILSSKKVMVSASNFYFLNVENKILTPLNKLNKRGSSSADWQKAYQAIKHNRVKNLNCGNIKNLIRAMAGLFLLNLYYKDTVFTLDKDNYGTNFDNSLGSSIFSIKIHINQNIKIHSDFTKNDDFDECVYLLKSTDETRIEVQKSLKLYDEKILEKIQTKMTDELTQIIMEMDISNKDEFNKNIKVEVERLNNLYKLEAASENIDVFKKALDSLRYEAILNKNVY